jgi:hypothetical protein
MIIGFQYSNITGLRSDGYAKDVAFSGKFKLGRPLRWGWSPPRRRIRNPYFVMGV